MPPRTRTSERFRYRDGTPSRPRPRAPSGFVDRRIPGVPMPPDWQAELPFDILDISAIRACAEGNASKEQAKRAIDAMLAWTRTYENPFHADPIIHAYWAGGRAMGLMLIKMINYRPRSKEEGEHG